MICLSGKVRCCAGVIIMTLMTTLPLASQTLLPSTLSLSATPSPLVLPGSLTLTSMANQAPVAGGVPFGTINFSYDGSKSLGAAALKILPPTQAFPSAASATLSTYGFAPVGIVSINGLSQVPGTLVGADATNVVTLYRVANPIGTPAVYQYVFPQSSSSIDALAQGYFLKPKPSGTLSALVHQNSGSGPGNGAYSVFDGSVTAPVEGTLSTPVTSLAGCACSDPDSETVAIDDFDGDGYSDVGKLVGASTSAPVVGVTLNDGASNPGSFQTIINNVAFPTFIAAVLPAAFCPSAMATGNFTGSTGSQLAVLGKTTAGGNCTAVLPTDPSSVLTCALAAQNTQLVLVKTTAVDATASGLAAADLNGDGKVDLIVAESTLNGVKVLLGNGDGTFMTPSALINTLGAPVSLVLADLNGDGSPDLAATLGSNGGLAILLNDGTGNLKSASQPFAIASTPVGLAATDLNGDGLADLAIVLPGVISTASIEGAIDVLINSAASQATLTIVDNPATAQPLPAGSHTLTASFPGDTNFAATTSPTVNENVTQTVPTVTWMASSAAVEGTPLAFTQPSASVPGAFTFSPAMGTTVPNVQSLTVTATFTPADTFDYTTAGSTQVIEVNLPPAVVTISVPATITPGQNPDINLTLNPFPDPVTVTVTLSFAPSPPNTIGDPMIVFSNNETTFTAPTIAANTPAAPLSIAFQSGSTAGVITVTTKLTDTVTGANVTPASLAPEEITVPAAAPVISSGTLTRSGSSLQVALSGLSSTRDMSQAEFHFTPVSGKSLATNELTVQLTSAFQTWYQSTPSDAFGTTFTYTQPFTISGDAADVQSVTVTLTNSQGMSEPSTVQ
jgi:hypothetical protein